MLTFPQARIVAIGEAMVEMAPVGEGLYRRGYAGDTFNTVWHMAQLLGDAARSGFVTRVGRDGLSDAFVAEMAADGLDVSGVTRDPERGMGLYLIELDGVERSFHYWRHARRRDGWPTIRPPWPRPCAGRPDPPVRDHPSRLLKNSRISVLCCDSLACCKMG